MAPDRQIPDTGYRLRMLAWDPSDDDIEDLVIDALEALPGAVPRSARERRDRHRGRGDARPARVGRRARPLRALPGRPADAPGPPTAAPIPSKITIFRGPLVRANRTPERLAAAVADTVYHEIAHHFGISDARLHELQAERQGEAEPTRSADQPAMSASRRARSARPTGRTGRRSGGARRGDERPVPAARSDRSKMSTKAIPRSAREPGHRRVGGDDRRRAAGAGRRSRRRPA